MCSVTHLIRWYLKIVRQGIFLHAASIICSVICDGVIAITWMSECRTQWYYNDFFFTQLHQNCNKAVLFVSKSCTISSRDNSEEGGLCNVQMHCNAETLFMQTSVYLGNQVWPFVNCISVLRLHTGCIHHKFNSKHSATFQAWSEMNVFSLLLKHLWFLSAGRTI